MEKILKCSFSITELNLLKLNLLRQWLKKYQMSSQGPSFGLPHTYLNIFFSEITGLFDGLFIDCLGHLTKMYMVKTKFVPL